MFSDNHCFNSGLVIAGIVIEATHVEAVQSYIFFIAGAICLIPGGEFKGSYKFLKTVKVAIIVPSDCSCIF